MIITILLGFLVGALAKLALPGKDLGGWIITSILGIAGSSVAYLLGSRAGFYGEHDPSSLIASIAGAVFLLALYRLLVVKTARVQRH